MPFKYSAYVFICLLALLSFRALQIFSDSRFGHILTTSTQGLKECFLLLFFIASFFPTFFFPLGLSEDQGHLGFLCSSCSDFAPFSQWLCVLQIWRTNHEADVKLTHSPIGSTMKAGGCAWLPFGQNITVWSPLALSRTPRQETSALGQCVERYCTQNICFKIWAVDRRPLIMVIVMLMGHAQYSELASEHQEGVTCLTFWFWAV